MLTWNVGDTNGTERVGYFDDLIDGSLYKTAAAFSLLGAVDYGPGDKTTVEFCGTFNGAVFTLYDYRGTGTLHIGGHRFACDGKVLDVEGLKRALTDALRELDEAEPLRNPRSKGDDDGVEYGHPGDYMKGLE